MKRKLSAIAILGLVLSGLGASPAQANATVGCTTSGTFTIVSNVVTTNTSCNGAAAIPDSVIAIADDAFVGATGLTAVTFGPNSQLTTIGQRAFERASSLATIAIPDRVTSIGSAAFLNATGLTSVTFGPNSQLSTMDDAVFMYASRLENFAAPDSLNWIPTRAFQEATALRSVTFGPNSRVSSIGSEAFRGATGLLSISMPDSVEVISDGAFLGATALHSLSFGANSRLETIQPFAFFSANALTSVSFPRSVTSILEGAFRGATSLSSVTFAPNSQLTTIGNQAFFGASGITTMAVPASVTSIGVSAFEGANRLASISFPENSQLTSIGLSAFRGASALATIAIPDPVTLIGSQAFENATSLTSISFGPSSQLATIGGNAFNNATSLRSITFPASLTNIGSSAFSAATAFVEAIFLGPPPTVGSNAFRDTGAQARALVKRVYIGSGSGKYGDAGSIWNVLRVEVPSSTLSLNAGEGVITQTVQFGEVPANPNTSRTGFTLQGWGTAQGGPATIAPDLSNFTMGPSARTLFAVWEPLPAATSSAEIEPAILQFGGPLVAGVDRRVFESGVQATMTLAGKRFHLVTAVTINGLKVNIASQSRASLGLRVPGLAPGRYALVLHTRTGQLSIPRFLVIE